MDPPPSSGRTARAWCEPGRERRLAILLALCVAATLSLGVAKLFVQRAHPPAWTVTGTNTFEGFVSIDRYCERAARIRAWLVGDDPGGAQVLEHVRAHGHATALLVPGCVALLSLVTGSIVLAFALLSAAAFVLQVLLVGLLARRLVPGAALVAGLLAATLTAAHCDSARTAVQLLLDPFTAAFSTLIVLTTLRWLERRDVRTALLLLAAECVACTVKLAVLPVLASPAILALICAPGRKKSALAVTIGVGLLPLLALQTYTQLVLDESMFSAEIGEMWSRNVPTRASIRNFLVEMVVLLQFVPFVLLRGCRALRRDALAVLAVGALLLLSVASVRLHDDARLYLPVLGLALAGATPALLAVVPERWIVRGAALFAAVNLSAAAVALLV